MNEDIVLGIVKKFLLKSDAKVCKHEVALDIMNIFLNDDRYLSIIRNISDCNDDDALICIEELQLSNHLPTYL